MRRLSIFLLLFSQVLAAQEAPFNNFFANQREIFSESSHVEHFRLALSKLKKINNAWVLDREEFVSGNLYRRTVELDSNDYLAEVLGITENYFLQRQAKELFRCDGLDCGSSNAWANNYFNVKQLYGLDPSQAYRVWSVNLDGRLAYATTYIVQRGNKRIYVHLDVLTPEKSHLTAPTISPDPKSITFALNKFKYYLIPQLQSPGGFATDNTLLKPVAEALNANPIKKVVVVGYDFAGSTSDERKKNSLNYANQVAELLIQLGVKEGRLSTQGLGSLVPQLNAAPYAVYLVLD